jgi:hypothetical protein
MAAAFSCLWSRMWFATIFLSEIENGKRGVPVVLHR